MLIIPAVDIRNGQCVRLVHGDPKKMTVYSADPFEMGQLWFTQGAKRIHVVDLDGAFEGSAKHLDIAGRMKKELGCEIEFGGGLRSQKVVEQALELEIDYLIFGTAALKEQSWMMALLKKYGSRFIVGIDALKDKVTLQGWQENSSFGITDALKKMEQMGFQTVIYTDIHRDGTLEGPNFEAIRDVLSKTSMKMFASGGVSQIKDVEMLSEISGVEGVIICKALYEGKVSIQDCLKFQRSQ